MVVLRRGSQLGKYKIRRRVASGGFADVYEARDTIEGVAVALKIPHASLVNDELMADFRREIRIAAALDHPNILPIRNAQIIDGVFVVASPLGEGNLAQVLSRRSSLRGRVDLAEQILEALAYAHESNVMHCDVKPENFIVFPGRRLRLADFGVARLAQSTVAMSGAGTVGYIAPEQAVGRASFRSDVFSIGIILCEMFGGGKPDWPYEWPPPRVDRLRQSVHAGTQALIRRATELSPRKRYGDAGAMLRAFRVLKKQGKILAGGARRRVRTTRKAGGADWRTLRQRQFKRLFGRVFDLQAQCSRCKGPISEGMSYCPWCASERKRHNGATRRRMRCPRCRRGRNPDWRYCPWCWGPGFAQVSEREYKDAQATSRCANRDCSRKKLSAFMRYCPWCHAKVQRPWKAKGVRYRCARCSWSVVPEYWAACPWCGDRLPHAHQTGKIG